MSTEIERIERHETAIVRHADELTVEAMVAQVTKIQQAMKAVMSDGVHFGVVPGTEKKDKDGKDVSKPSLYKPGAEKLCLMFRLDPQYNVERTTTPDGHLDVLVTCTLWHITSGQRIASGVGSCSTRESRYAYRNASRLCPACGEPAIIKGQDKFGGGWVCWKKPEKGKNGCGAKFADGDTTIEKQEVGRIANVDIADQYNTVVKMGCKRALVAAVLNGTAASDIFTQDVEDMPASNGGAAVESTARVEPKAKPAEPAVDEVTRARSQSLHQVFVKKFGRQTREVCLGVVARDIGRIVTSFNDLSKFDAAKLFEIWNALPDGGGIPITPPKGSPDYAAASPPAAPPDASAPADAGADAAAKPDNGLPFGDVDVENAPRPAAAGPPKLLGDRILEAAAKVGRSNAQGHVQVDLGLSRQLDIRGGWWGPYDLVSAGVGDHVLAYFEQSVPVRTVPVEQIGGAA